MMNGLNLSLVSHYINCNACQNQEQCDIARMLVTSQSTSDGLSSAENVSPAVQNRNSLSDPELSRRGDR